MGLNFAYVNNHLHPLHESLFVFIRTAKPHLSIAMADPGTTELQLGIHYANTPPTTPEPTRRPT